MTPEQIRDMTAELYAEIREQLWPQSWHCGELAALAMGIDRATGGCGKLVRGELRLPNGDVCQHVVFFCSDGRVIDACDGEIRLSDRGSIGLSLPMVRTRGTPGADAVRVPPRRRSFKA